MFLWKGGVKDAGSPLTTAGMTKVEKTLGPVFTGMTEKA
jgi:hypothetical protein